MKEKKLFLSVDLGTQGVRVGIIDENGELLSGMEEAYIIKYPHSGWAEQSPSDWISSFKIALSKSLQNLKKDERAHISSICACATSSTVIAVNRDGKPLRDAIMWMDCRSTKEVEIVNGTKSKILKYCGGSSSAEWLIPKVLWTKINDPELYQKTYKFVEQLDWFNFILTGTFRASLCNATCKGHYVAEEGGWDKEFFEEIGLPDFKDKLVTDVCSIGEVVGIVSDGFCDEFGLPHGIPLYEGGIDAYAGMLGLGVVKSGSMATIMGTSFVHLCFSKKADRLDGIWGPYKDALIKDYYVIEGGQSSAGSITKWFRNIAGNGTIVDVEEISKEADRVGIGAHGLSVIDFFQGNRTPYKNASVRGRIDGLSLASTRGDIFRALMESVAFGTRNIIDNFSKGGTTVERFVACGGITKNTVWLSIISDVCRMPISTVNSSSFAGIMGCALISAVANGVYSDYRSAAEVMVKEVSTVKPDFTNSDRYDALFRKYVSNCQAITGLNKAEEAL